MNVLKSLVLLLILSYSQIGVAQKSFTKTGSITFSSEASLEKIEAQNNSANCVFDAASNKIEWGVLIKGFQFEKALMQEHFNENYMESTKFPKATFKGMVTGFDSKKSGPQNVKVSGDMTMHGVTKKITTDAVMNAKGKDIESSATFTVALADYNISIPAVVKDQVAKTVKIKVLTTLKPLK